MYRPEIPIEYEVNGKTHVVTTYDMCGTYSSDREANQAMLDRFDVGREYPCWYDPLDHDVAVLVRGYTWWHLAGVRRSDFVSLDRQRRSALLRDALGQVGRAPGGDRSKRRSLANDSTATAGGRSFRTSRPAATSPTAPARGSGSACRSADVHVGPDRRVGGVRGSGTGSCRFSSWRWCGISGGQPAVAPHALHDPVRRWPASA